MVIVADLAIMIGLPVALWTLHRLWPSAVENRKPLMLSILAGWFCYTFFGSRLMRGESMLMVGYSALIMAVLAAGMVLVVKKFPEQARKYDRYFRIGFMAAAAAAMLAGWTTGGF